MPDNAEREESAHDFQDRSDSPTVAGREPEVGEVHLVYEIEGRPNEVPIFELSRTLEGLGNVIQEGYQILNPDRHEVVVKVKPFQEGSFVMDFVLSIQNNPTVLFFLTQPEAISRIKNVLEYLGLIKNAREAVKTVLEVIDFLRNGKPNRVEPDGPDSFNYYNQDGQVMPVTQPIHSLINNGTIQQFIYPAIGGALEREKVESVKTFIKNEKQKTEVRIPKEKAPALKAFSEPEPEPPLEEVLENITTELLNPKSGTYGETEGTWVFTRAGSSKNQFRASIADRKFLNKFGRGSVRFYRDDLLKVNLRSEQHLKMVRARRYGRLSKSSITGRHPFRNPAASRLSLYKDACHVLWRTVPVSGLLQIPLNASVALGTPSDGTTALPAAGARRAS